MCRLQLEEAMLPDHAEASWGEGRLHIHRMIIPTKTTSAVTIRPEATADLRLDAFRFRSLRQVGFAGLVQFRCNLFFLLVDQFLPALNQVVSALP